MHGSNMWNLVRMSPPQPSSKQVFLRVRFLDPSFSIPSSPPFNLSPASSMLINNNMRMIPKFLSPYQEVQFRGGLPGPGKPPRNCTCTSHFLVLSQWSCFKSRKVWGHSPRHPSSLDNITQVDVNGSPISMSDSIKLLGVTIDSSLPFNKHVSLICQSCQYYIRALRHICPILDANTARLVGHFGELPTWLRQPYHVWHVEIPDR